MIYLIDGQEQYFISEKINEICQGDGKEIIRFDGFTNDISCDDIVDACESNSLFAEKKVVLVYEPLFLIKKVDENKTKKLIDYVNHPLYETDLVFYTYANSFNTKLKIYKIFANNSQIISLNSLDYRNFNNYVREQAHQYNLEISYDAINYLGSICKKDATLLHSNLEILSLYPGIINTDVINKLCTSSDEGGYFDLVNTLINKNVSLAISIERKMLSDNESILGIIGLLASQLRFLYYVSYLRSINKSKNQIISICQTSENRINKAFESLKNLRSAQIMELLSKLCLLDCRCKTDSSISEQAYFELFILDFLKKGNYASN